MLSDFMCTFFKENGIDRTLVMHAYTCEYAILTLAFNLLGPVNWTLFGVYEEGNNKEDIKFKDPMSTFSFCNMLMEPPSSLPSCLYYVVK